MKYEPKRTPVEAAEEAAKKQRALAEKERKRQEKIDKAAAAEIAKQKRQFDQHLKRNR
jgi:hypothetical protein